MLSFWKERKMTTVMAGSGLAKALLDNYWIFTPTPLSEGNDSPVGKTFYMLLQIVFTIVLYAGVGFLIDLAKQSRQEENRPLLPI